MEVKKTWIISDDDGKDIFYFHLLYIEKDEDGYLFDTNLSIQSNPESVINKIELLISPGLTENEIDVLAQDIFEAIKVNPFYKQFYFSDQVLNRNGKFNLEYYNTLNKINLKKISQDTLELTPMSETSYPELFEIFKKHFIINQAEIMNNSKEISKTDFEVQLVNNELRNEYINSYDLKNSFFKYSDDSGEITYFVLNKSVLLFAFDTHNFVI